jgi:redox-sensitive bicupin YhaK (pirin superfamily)
MSTMRTLLFLLIIAGTTTAFSTGLDSRRKIATRNRSHRFYNAGALESMLHLSAFDMAHENSRQPTDTQLQSAPRRIARLEKFARLPVWPVWNGVFIFFVSKIFGEEVAAKLEDNIGGRVCPNFFQETDQTSPFIMLVHHRHTFAAWDILRYLQRTFFPEGFPAHPHRGFVTVTYILKGGFQHRDSLGVKQLYGAEERHSGKHTQWLTTGGGILHEEMFDMGFKNFFQPCDQELYQLWLNLPSKDKLTPPRIDLLGGDDETPCVKVTDTNGRSTETIVIAGQHGTKVSTAPIRSDLAILHVRMDPGTVWRHAVPTSHETVVLYMRRGSAEVKGTRVPPHYTAYLSTQGSDLTVRSSPSDGADFLLLAGQPLREPVAAQGSMVMNYPDEINVAYQDYQMGEMGRPWSEKLSDSEWAEHVKQNPSQYMVE